MKSKIIRSLILATMILLCIVACTDLTPMVDKMLYTAIVEAQEKESSSKKDQTDTDDTTSNDDDDSDSSDSDSNSGSSNSGSSSGSGSTGNTDDDSDDSTDSNSSGSGSTGNTDDDDDDDDSDSSDSNSGSSNSGSSSGSSSSSSNVTTDTEDDDAGYDSSITFTSDADDYDGEISSATGTEEGYEYVDLGLSSGLMWARMNIGAETPEERGSYYAWGEITTKDEYSDDNCANCGLQIDDIIGNPEYDAAAALWGGHWRMPDTDEFQELIDECDWDWVKYNDVTGYVVTGPNGSSIFLPTSGYMYLSTLYYESSKGLYWSAIADTADTDMAYHLYFYSTKYDYNSFWNYRRNGRVIRAIYDEDFEYEDDAIKLVAGTSSKTWYWDTEFRDEGRVWGNAGYAAADNGCWYSGIWWGATCEDDTDTGLVGQLAHSDTGVATGEELSDAYMIFTTSGSLTSYDGQGNIIRQGTYSISGYDGTYNQPDKTGTLENWAMGTLTTTTGTILWPFKINGGGTTVGDFEIMALDDDQLQLIYADESNGSWAECTWWVFRAEDAFSETDTDNNSTTTTTGTINGYEYVDLGLTSGLKWATVNIGATLPADYGNYYAWGEIETKDTYTSSNSVTYGDSSYGDISGDATYDAASANWGSSWRMPTLAEIEELVDDCTWTWTTQENSDGEETYGYLVEGTNGNSIFLPAAGYRPGSSLRSAGVYGSYWCSSPVTTLSSHAYNLYFGSSSYYWANMSRADGNQVRPVSE